MSKYDQAKGEHEAAASQHERAINGADRQNELYRTGKAVTLESIDGLVLA